MSELTVTVACKKGDNKAFKAVEGGVWYNVKDPVIPFLEKVNKGDVITITTEKKGASQYVTKITKSAVTAPEPTQEPAVEETSDAPKCTVCGKALKNPKYPTCYTCKGKVPTGATVKKSYDSPEKTAQIQRGNALNASAAVASGQQFVNTETGLPDLETAQQFTLLLADAFLEWLRAE
jgi:hypothetical protein